LATAEKTAAVARGLVVASHRETQTTSTRDRWAEKNQVPAPPPNPHAPAKLLPCRFWDGRLHAHSHTLPPLGGQVVTPGRCERRSGWKPIGTLC